MLPNSNPSTSSSKFNRTHWLEKVFRILIPAGLIYGGMQLFNGIAPTLLLFFDNFWKIAIFSVATLSVVLYVLKNPMFLWMTYKNICRKITSWFVKNDPLSYMESYVDILINKQTNLQKSLQFIIGKKNKLQRLVNDLIEKVDFNFKKAVAAQNQGNNKLASSLSSIAARNKESIEVYRPMIERMQGNIEFLKELDENWGYSIAELADEIERKKTEYEFLRENAEAVSQAQAFIKGETEDARVFQMSLDALEESVSQKIAQIEEFERNAKPMMQSISIEKQMINDEGLRLLEEYKSKGSLIMPASFAVIQREKVAVSNDDNEFSHLLNN